MNNIIERKLTIRFSDKEKRILYGLLHKYEHIIDYRQRKNSIQKPSDVRRCWESILQTFNDHPETNGRTLKQLQKFWLNSKLRKLIPTNYSNNSTKCSPITFVNTNNFNSRTIKTDSDEDYNNASSYANDENDSSSMKSQQQQQQQRTNDISFVSVQQQQQQQQIPSSRQFSINNSVTLFRHTNGVHLANEINENPNDLYAEESSTTANDNNDVNDEIVPDNQAEYDHLSNVHHQHEDTMNILLQEEMKHRVKESKYRSEVQLTQLEKAQAELIHLRAVHEMELAHKREMNRLELQTAKARYENLIKQS